MDNLRAGPKQFAAGAVVFAALVTAALAVLGAASDGTRESLGKIAFVRDGDIWVQDLPDGTPRQLTHRGGARMPQWSPSGEWLLYWRGPGDSGPEFESWLVKADGSEERRLGDGGFTSYWLPGDQNRVVYSISVGGSRSNVELVAEDPDGSNREVLSQSFVEGDRRVNRIPFMWFPEHSRMYYTEIHNPVNPDVRDGPAPVYQALWVSDEDWSNARELTDVGALSVEQETSVLPFGWTSDGEYLFVLYEDQDNERAILAGAELFAIPASGDEARPLELKVTLQERLATSHVGVAVSTGSGLAAWTDRRIAVIAPDVSSHATLTPEDMAAVSPVWSPDGSRIAFVATEERGLEARDEALASQRIWVMNADGSNQRQLTSATSFRDAAPMWSRDGETLLFARMSTEDPCYGTSFDLMAYRFDGERLERLVKGLALHGTWFDTEVGQIPECETSRTGLITQIHGSMNLAPVLTWWQPALED